MKPEEFKIEHIQEIFRLYQEYCGGYQEEYVNNLRGKAALVLEEVVVEGFASRDGFRVGSKWSGDSKLRFERDYASGNFNPTFVDNMYPQDRRKKEAVEAGKRFEIAALEYLCSQEQRK